MEYVYILDVIQLMILMIFVDFGGFDWMLTDIRTHGHKNRQTDPYIEMQGRILKHIYHTVKHQPVILKLEITYFFPEWHTHLENFPTRC